jgi:hypothetical protein
MEVPLCVLVVAEHCFAGGVFCFVLLRSRIRNTAQSQALAGELTRMRLHAADQLPDSWLGEWGGDVKRVLIPLSPPVAFLPIQKSPENGDFLV